MAQSDSESNGEESSEIDIDDVASRLQAQMTAEQLRRLAAHAEGVSRPRGARKAETAEVVAEQAPEFAAAAAEGGDFTVSCTCGLEFSVDHPQVARREAKRHKAQRITHFPTAADESGEEPVPLYG